MDSLGLILLVSVPMGLFFGWLSYLISRWIGREERR